MLGVSWGGSRRKGVKVAVAGVDEFVEECKTWRPCCESGFRLVDLVFGSFACEGDEEWDGVFVVLQVLLGGPGVCVCWGEGRCFVT